MARINYSDDDGPGRHDAQSWTRQPPSIELSASAQARAHQPSRRSPIAHGHAFTDAQISPRDQRRPLLHKLWRGLTRGTVLGAILMTLTISACGSSYDQRSTPAHAHDSRATDVRLEAQEARETANGQHLLEAHENGPENPAEAAPEDDEHTPAGDE